MKDLIFLPGLLCNEAVWQSQARALSHLVTPWIADLTRDDSIAAMARRVLAEAPDRFGLAAVSMGGYVAFEIMRQAPERVEKLALFDTSAAPDSAERIARRKAGIESLEHGRFIGVTKLLMPRLIHASKLGGPVDAQITEMAARVGQEAYLRQQQAILGRPGSLPTLPAIDIPTLVAVGDADVLTPPADALEILLGIPNSELHVFRRCGHLPPLEQPEETAEILQQWLAW